MYDIIGGGKIGEYMDQLSIAEILTQLVSFSSYRIVRFVGTEYSPCGTSAYRGSYDQLAINYSTDETTVAEFSKLLEEAYKKEYTGYKGGQYKMFGSTPVWASRDSSDYSRMAIVSVFLSEGGYVYLGTRFED
jgi:hypothetical protein